jgi:hypothetical protein
MSLYLLVSTLLMELSLLLCNQMITNLRSSSSSSHPFTIMVLYLDQYADRACNIRTPDANHSAWNVSPRLPCKCSPGSEQYALKKYKGFDPRQKVKVSRAASSFKLICRSKPLPNQQILFCLVPTSICACRGRSTCHSHISSFSRNSHLPSCITS